MKRHLLYANLAVAGKVMGYLKYWDSMQLLRRQSNRFLKALFLGVADLQVEQNYRSASEAVQ